MSTEQAIYLVSNFITGVIAIYCYLKLKVVMQEKMAARRTLRELKADLHGEKYWLARVDRLEATIDSLEVDNDLLYQRLEATEEELMEHFHGTWDNEEEDHG